MKQVNLLPLKITQNAWSVMRIIQTTIGVKVGSDAVFISVGDTILVLDFFWMDQFKHLGNKNIINFFYKNYMRIHLHLHYKDPEKLDM